MSRNYFKSKEGLDNFASVGLPYPDNNMWDHAWEKYEKATKISEPKDNKLFITQIKRLVIPGEGVFIIHDENYERKDMLGNRKKFYKSNIGIAPKPIPKYEIKMNMDTFEKENVRVGLDMVETEYTIPFTKENADRLHKLCTEVTAYSIQVGTAGQRIHVDTFEDWRDGEEEEILSYGHKCSQYEKQQLLDKKAGKFQLPPNRLYR